MLSTVGCVSPVLLLAALSSLRSPRATALSAAVTGGALGHWSVLRRPASHQLECGQGTPPSSMRPLRRRWLVEVKDARDSGSRLRLARRL